MIINISCSFVGLKFVNPGFGLPNVMSRSADETMGPHTSEQTSHLRNGNLSSSTVDHHAGGVTNGSIRASTLPGSRKNEEFENVCH